MTAFHHAGGQHGWGRTAHCYELHGSVVEVGEAASQGQAASGWRRHHACSRARASGVCIMAPQHVRVGSARLRRWPGTLPLVATHAVTAWAGEVACHVCCQHIARVTPDFELCLGKIPAGGAAAVTKDVQAAQACVRRERRIEIPRGPRTCDGGGRGNEACVAFAKRPQAGQDEGQLLDVRVPGKKWLTRRHLRHHAPCPPRRVTP